MITTETISINVDTAILKSAFDRVLKDDKCPQSIKTYDISNLTPEKLHIFLNTEPYLKDALYDSILRLYIWRKY